MLVGIADFPANFVNLGIILAINTKEKPRHQNGRANIAKKTLFFQEY